VEVIDNDRFRKARTVINKSAENIKFYSGFSATFQSGSPHLVASAEGPMAGSVLLGQRAILLAIKTAGAAKEKTVSTPTETRLTPEEYLRLERLVETRSEFFGGELIPMPGVSRQHNRINRNLLHELETQLFDRPCEIFFCDMRVKIPVTGSYAYPDVAVLCGEPTFEDANVDTLLNPQVLIEVLSESTEAHDRGRKLRQYRSIESLHEYILVSQSEQRIERYARQLPGEWTYSDVTDPAETIFLASLDCRLTVSRVYRGINFKTGK